MALKAAMSQLMSQISAVLSPSQTNIPDRRMQPKRNAKKKLDNDFVYTSTVSETSSLLIENTLTDSQFFLSSPRCNLTLAKDTQPVLSGNDSLVFETQNQSVIPETQDSSNLTPSVLPETQDSSNIAHSQVIPATPPSQHGSMMRSALSTTMTDDNLTPSLFPMPSYDVDRSLSTMTSTPMSSNRSPSMSQNPETQSISTQTLPKQMAQHGSQTVAEEMPEHGTQTTPLEMTDQSSQTELSDDDPPEIALFRSNGNLSVLSNFYEVDM